MWGISGPGIIRAFDFDAAKGTISNERLFAKTKHGDVFVDGSAIDAAGYLWSAVWNGWCIRRYAPDGTIERTIEMPVQRPTSCCLRGPNMSTLYIIFGDLDLERRRYRTPAIGRFIVCG